MAKIDGKRFSLLSVVNHLHVLNALSTNSDNREQCGLKKFINPKLLQSRNPEEAEITIVTDGTDKIKRKVYSLSNSKKTEGGTLVCELCGHRSFKLYPKTLGTADDGNKVTTVRKKICRKCFTGDHMYKRRDQKRKVRPTLDHQPGGLTDSRASKSWHFIRRSFVRKKENELINHKCYENEYSDKFLSDISSGETECSSCDEDDDDEEENDSDEINKVKKYSLPFQHLNDDIKKNMCFPVKQDIPEIHRPYHSYINDIRNKNAYQEHIAMRDNSSGNSDNGISPDGISTDSLSPKNRIYDDHLSPEICIKRPADLEKAGHLLSAENNISSGINIALAVSENKDLSRLPLLIELETSPKGVSTKEEHSTDDCSVDDSIASDIDPSMNAEICSLGTGMTTIATSSEDEYIEVEYLDEDNLESKMLSNIESDLEILHINTDPHLVTRLFTPCIHGSSADDDLYYCFDDKPVNFKIVKNVYDRTVIKKKELTKKKSKVSYPKGVCKLVTVINRKRSHYVNASFNSCLYDHNGVYCKKQDLPLFVQLDDENIRQQKPKTGRARKKGMESFLSKPNSKHPCTPGKVFNPDNLTLKELKEKYWPKSMSGRNIDGKEMMPETPPKIDKPINCPVCNRSIIKSYSTFNRNSAPLKLLKYFKDTENKIRVCRACFPYIKASPTHPTESGRPGINLSTKFNKKRPLPNEFKDVPVAFKINKSDSNKAFYTASQNFVKGIGKYTTTNTNFQRIAPKLNYADGTAVYPNNNLQNVRVANTMPSLTIMSNGSVGKNVNSSTSLQSPLGISSFGRLNLKVVQNPDAYQIKNLAQNYKTKYVIVQTAPTSGDSKVQKLSTDKTSGIVIGGETRLGNHGGDITINGQKYKIDTEFKLNDLVKDNENALLSSETQQDILNRLPSILKRSVNTKTGLPPTFRMVNIVENNRPLTNSTCPSSVSSTDILDYPSLRPRKIVVQSIASTPPKIAGKVNTCISSSSIAGCSIVTSKKDSLVSLAPKPDPIVIGIKAKEKAHKNIVKNVVEIGLSENNGHTAHKIILNSPVKSINNRFPAQTSTTPVLSNHTSSLVRSLSGFKSSITTNSLLPSISRQIQQQIKTTSVLTTKPHAMKVSTQIQNTERYKSVKQSNGNQVLGLKDGIKIVGNYLNTQGMKSCMLTAGQINESVHASIPKQPSGTTRTNACTGIVNGFSVNKSQSNIQGDRATHANSNTVIVKRSDVGKDMTTHGNSNTIIGKLSTVKKNEGSTTSFTPLSPRTSVLRSPNKHSALPSRMTSSTQSSTFGINGSSNKLFTEELNPASLSTSRREPNITKLQILNEKKLVK